MAGADALIPITDIVGLATCALVAIATGLALVNVARFGSVVRAGALVILVVMMLIPVNGLIVAAYVRGLIGDPSFATVVLMAIICLRHLTGRPVCSERNIAALLILSLVSGAALYPLALGLSMYDPYALGFGSWELYLALLTISMVAWRMQLHLAVFWIVASVLGYTFRLYEATNLWNYLIDPLIVVIALVWVVTQFVKHLRQSKLAQQRSLA